MPSAAPAISKHNLGSLPLGVIALSWERKEERVSVNAQSEGRSSDPLCAAAKTAYTSLGRRWGGVVTRVQTAVDGSTAEPASSKQVLHGGRLFLRLRFRGFAKHRPQQKVRRQRSAVSGGNKIYHNNGYSFVRRMKIGDRHSVHPQPYPLGISIQHRYELQMC